MKIFQFCYSNSPFLSITGLAATICCGGGQFPVHATYSEAQWARGQSCILLNSSPVCLTPWSMTCEFLFWLSTNTSVFFFFSGWDTSEAKLSGQNCQVLGDPGILSEDPQYRTTYSRSVQLGQGEYSSLLCYWQLFYVISPMTNI